MPRALGTRTTRWLKQRGFLLAARHEGLPSLRVPRMATVTRQPARIAAELPHESQSVQRRSHGGARAPRAPCRGEPPPGSSSQHTPPSEIPQARWEVRRPPVSRTAFAGSQSAPPQTREPQTTEQPKQLRTLPIDTRQRTNLKRFSERLWHGRKRDGNPNPEHRVRLGALVRRDRQVRRRTAGYRRSGGRNSSGDRSWPNDIRTISISISGRPSCERKMRRTGTRTPRLSGMYCARRTRRRSPLPRKV